MQMKTYDGERPQDEAIYYHSVSTPGDSSGLADDMDLSAPTTRCQTGVIKCFQWRSRVLATVGAVLVG